MADVKISDLPVAAALDGAETTPVVQAAGTVKVTLNAIYAWILALIAARLLPTGGTAAQALRKTSATDYDAAWADVRDVTAGGTTDHVLTKTAAGYDWAAPPATPVAGAERAIQYRAVLPATGLAGALYAEIRNDTLTLNEVAAPIAPGAGQVSLFNRLLANRSLPASIGPTELGTALQPFFGRSKIGLWSALGNVATPPLGIGLANATAVGTNGIRSVAATNLLTSMRRSLNNSTAAAGTSGGYRLLVSQFFRSTSNYGGFFLVARFGEDTIVADSRAFIGVHTSLSALGNVNPSTFLNTIGIGYDSGQSTWRVMHNDGSGVATTIDLGASFPCNTDDEAYDVVIFAPFGQATVWVQMIRLSNETSVTHEITTDLPALNLLMTFHSWVNNGPTAAVKGLCLSTLYTENPY